MKNITLIASLFICINSYSQSIVNCTKIQPEEDYENIHIKKLDSDANKTSFIIWVKNNVRPHMHEHHTETLYVIEGEGLMKVGEEELKITPGDYLNIPKSAVHSVEVTSDTPLKVISVQAPEFLGKDRVFIE